MTRWTPEKANSWYADQPMLVGCNFIPSNAINQLEMWQAETFDPETIDRELGWAADIGMNSVRVYLHNLLWTQDAEGFKERIARFLAIADRHGISTLLTFFDDCWHDGAQLGKQPALIQGVHNSRWVRSPGSQILNDKAQWHSLKAYVQDILQTFGQDQRVVMWDLYNEVGNQYLPTLATNGILKPPKLSWLRFRQRFLPSASLELLKVCFAWAWKVRPSQPLTSSIWFADSRLNSYLLDTDDVITFHNYKPLDDLKAQIALLKSFGRPVICTEWMARTQHSLIQTHFPVFQQSKVGCYGWGLVNGKTQTIYMWREPMRDGGVPNVWFHDLLHADGRPYDTQEVEILQQLK